MKKRPHAETQFLRDVADSGDVLSAAGIGLEGIGLMLSERELSSSEANALHHAVIALGTMVKSQGYSLFSDAKKLEGSQ
ncbi:hypothetical protein EQ832_12880 [Pseudomonas sp. ALS1131]|nr:hypothetical protein [Pseudomonas sp. ALS1131]TRO37667.1 hypothetical protein EQ832_12880 [Pseudomonas sp. ALS1131]